ncbi:MAG: FumA C-terminus/TtdB family hydratase beta subunit [Clostridia bacterium]|nr:FumA C-terminus/TtdB family hydratase beta subunit [Clostridia bacterium]
MEFKKINAPFEKEELATLKAGDYVYISGTILTGRDAAHKRLFECMKNGRRLPVNIQNQGIYYVGPCFKDGCPTSAGPTTSMRMDTYAPALYANSCLVSIGKGDRQQNVYDAIVKYGGVYFAAIGGAGAIYANAIKSASVVAYEDLGTEAIREFAVENFPVIVAIDSKGNSIYKR